MLCIYIYTVHSVRIYTCRENSLDFSFLSPLYSMKSIAELPVNVCRRTFQLGYTIKHIKLPEKESSFLKVRIKFQLVITLMQIN